MSVDIAAARKLVEATAVGPWRVEQVAGLDGYPVVVSGTRIVAACDTMLRSHDHAAFIAASRALVPALLDEVERMRVRLSDLRASCMSNYMGGHHEPLQLEAFRHGMATVCNVVDSIIKGTP